MATIIFYGAGINARENIARWRENGLKPVCFVDKKVELHRTIFSTPDGAEFEILPLLEAIAKYPDYILYLTQVEASLANVTEDLFGIGIPKERIRYCEGFLPPRYCHLLQMNLIEVSENHGICSYGNCCGPSLQQYRFLSSGDFGKDYEHLLEFNQKLKLLSKEGYYSRCYGCALLKNTLPTLSIKHCFIFGTNCASGCDLCNLKCIYCGYAQFRHKNKKMSVSITEGKRYDLLKCLQYIENNYIAEDVSITYAAGEIGVQKMHNEEILAIWNRNSWKGTIVTNATVFLSGIATLLEKKLIHLLTSLDSGTSETFKKIKGANLLDRVIENLTKYAEIGGGSLEIKYIVLEGINDNQNEIDQFINIVERLSNKHHNVFLSFSRDRRGGHLALTECELAAFKYIIEASKKKGLKCQPHAQTFSQTDIDRIYAENKEEKCHQ